MVPEAPPSVDGMFGVRQCGGRIRSSCGTLCFAPFCPVSLYVTVLRFHIFLKDEGISEAARKMATVELWERSATMEPYKPPD